MARPLRPPAITVFTAPPPLPPAPDLPAPTTSKLQPAPSDSTASGLQGRLWNEAYDDLKKEEPKLVDAYEILLSRELRESDSNLTDETSQKNEIEQTNSKTRRSQMVRLVRAGLEKTEKEATVKNNIQGITDIVSPIKGLVSAAVNSVPEAAIAWTGACFALQILANPINETVANRDGITYVISRMEWYWNLSSLLLEDNQVDNTAALRAELEKHIIDLYKQLFLYQMKSVCSYYRNRLVAALRDMVKLDDWEGALQSIKTAENAIQQDSDQYNTQEFKSYLRKLVGAAESLAADILPGIRQVLREIRQEDQNMEQDEKHDEKNKKCLADLLNTDPRDDKERIKQTKGGLLADSSNWILKHKRFRQWHDEDEARVLWIKGDPGKGKTMLMIAIVDELERQLKQSKQPNQQPNAILSYFFCQGTNSNLNNATAVLRGLIYLLADQNPSLISHLRKRYDTAGSKLFEGMNVFVSLSRVLEDMLREASLSRAYILIDALDECETELPQLLTFIAANSSVSPRVKWLVSSRNKIEIEQHLKLNGSAMNLSLELTQNAEQVSHAVNAYIDSKILEVDSLRNDPRERDQVRDIMHKRANGTFLWVALVIKELKDPATVDALYTVREVPTDLYQLYDRMITQIQQLRDPDSCWSVLSTATLANRPLHLAELSVLSRLPKIVSPSIEKVRKIVAMCGSFLTVQNDYVYHIHQSAKDYLSDKTSNTIFPSGPIEVHHAIFSQSLEAMLTLRRDIYGLRHPGTLVSDIKAPDPDPLAAIRYSCVHWISHFCDSYSSSYSEVKAVRDFFEGKFLYWLEAMGLVQHMGDAILSITRLETLLREQSADLNLIDLVYDSRRFILQNRWVIENYPLQAYISALIYSPVNCLIRTIFKHEEPEWVQPKPVLESNWSPCLQTLEGHHGHVYSVAFSPNSKLLASGSGDNTIKIWDITTGSLQQTFEDYHGHVYSVEFSPDSKLLASGSGNNTIKIWDITTGSLQQTLEDYYGPVDSVAFSPDSKLLASGSGDNTIKIWDITTGSFQQALEDHHSPVHSIAFSYDSKLLTSGSGDNTIKIWDITTGSLQQTLEDHHGSSRSVAFSSDSKLWASVSRDNIIKIWDITTGSLQQTFKNYYGHVYSVIFSPDSKLLASVSSDNTIKIWFDGGMDRSKGRYIDHKELVDTLGCLVRMIEFLGSIYLV
ncbi:putative NWD1 protein [Rosellinia necatrix]|uniref:Putative NWD1 protein n=1 Tax=Rosellinia necatrix TaxID=77044 RepID=A0A1S8A7Z7_ROSNE|nr:putative NWD1 protein [Rosellinia necatrix]